jgi:hypothetical protein
MPDTTTNDPEKGSGQTGPSGHEQMTAVLVSLVLWIASIAFGVYYRLTSEDPIAFDHWSWYVTNGIQTFMAFTLPAAYPGYATLAYTCGLIKGGPGSRLEAFYINATMGMVLGVPCMATLDHLMFVFAPVVFIGSWMPWAQVQLVTSGLSCACGLYMSLWIPTNKASNVCDPGPFVLMFIFVGTSIARLTVPPIAFDGPYFIILLAFNLALCAAVAFLFVRGNSRKSRVQNSLALINKICEDIGKGPVAKKTVWAVWPPGATFPSGWWFEPLPFGNKTGWPYEAWPQGDMSAEPSQEFIAAAATEMQTEFKKFLPLWLAVGFLPVLIIGLVAGAVMAPCISPMGFISPPPCAG